MANLSQQKRQSMLAFLNKIKEENKDNDEMLVALGEIENELNSKKYGLVWEEHEEQVDIMMKNNIPVFTEVIEKEIKETEIKLASMIDELEGNEYDMKGLSEFKALLLGE